MAVPHGVSRPECLLCSSNGPDVRERGRFIPLSADLCDRCWDEVANELAVCEGATAAPDPEFDPDDVEWVEPRTCRQCHAPVRCYPTNYDRWVELATFELPAKKVPPGHRWRLMHPKAANTPVPVATVAIRIGAIDPTPGEPVIPAHEFVCLKHEE
ncbi:DUF6083 domain-containing protein [Streptomyces sp. N50]|uniref:DUF6083 domain-containing protein n=1 Tax=Streptomyces sp. N50 TaxID=3081765 RepID=UPI00296216C1|nr:DUF6083 domain-containing protein [Streptomyces sp. N50]WOX10872.1 DUF6083 domain-containing protein [Streptomyces sp. N50]